MALNLFDLAKQYLSGNVADIAAGHLGESESAIRKGMEAVLPMSMLGITRKVESGDTDSIMSMAKEAFNGGILNNFAGLFSSSGGGVPRYAPGMLDQIFGNHLEDASSSVSKFAGLKGASTLSLLGTIVPLVLGLLGKQAKEDNLSASGLPGLFGSLKHTLLGALPAGLAIPWLSHAKEGERHAPLHHRPAATHHTEKKKNSWLMPVVLALLAVLLFFWLLKGCDKKETAEVATPPDTMMVTPAPVAAPAVARESIKVKLPNGVELDAYKGGIEDMLVTYLNSKDAIDAKKWFDFKDLNFKFGTAEIVPESKAEVNNLIKILQAYPKAKIKIGGYTDKVGDEAANKKLSQERANAVTKAMKDAGVGSQVADAEGYGSQFAQFPADAPEEDRIKDRRVAVNVRAK